MARKAPRKARRKGKLSRSPSGKGKESKVRKLMRLAKAGTRGRKR
jgi:hypothetical protein